jgi:hypothetical protein
LRRLVVVWLLVAPSSHPLVALPSHPLVARQLVIEWPPSNEAAAIGRPHITTTAAANTTATATAANVVELTIVQCLRKRQQQHHHQHTNGSTNVKMFTSPDDLDLFNLSTVS